MKNFEIGGSSSSPFSEKWDTLFDEAQDRDEVESDDSEERGTEEIAEKMKKFEKFFDNDIRVKKLLIESAPSEMDNVSDETRVEYSDRLFENYGEMMRGLSEMMEAYYPSREIEETLAGITSEIIESGADFDKLRRVYRDKMAKMDEEFVEGVHDEAQGFYLWGAPHKMDERAESVNEILHLIHSSVANDEKILEGLPQLEQSGEVSLRGIENEDAAGIFRELVERKVDVGITDIVGLKNRILMMVRDRGHALTIDVQKDDDGKVYANYFIPKICDIKMVNALPGVQKVTDESRTTSGIFQVDGNIAKNVADFVEKVPTDMDIPDRGEYFDFGDFIQD